MPGTMVRSVQPAPGATQPSGMAAVSSTRTVVVPTATTRRPSRRARPTASPLPSETSNRSASTR